jgi:hypothetical protein
MNDFGSLSWPTATAHSFAQTADNPTPGQTGGTTLAGAAEMLWPTPMAGTPAQNGNSAAGNSDFTRKVDALLDNWTTPSHSDSSRGGTGITEGMTGSSLTQLVAQWQTPVSDDHVDREKGKINSRGEPKLSGQAILWGTPRASDAEKGGPNQSFGAGGIPLPAQAAQWPTPRASENENRTTRSAPTHGETHGAVLAGVAGDMMAQNWPTPAARDHKGSSEASVTWVNGKTRMDLLDHRSEQGFSRPDLPTWPDGLTLSQLRLIWRPLRASVIASHGRPVWRRLWKSRAKRRLNPAFVGWLMGWPPGHTLCDCSATEFAHWQQAMRGALSQLPTASGPWIWKPTIEAPQAVQMVLI